MCEICHQDDWYCKHNRNNLQVLENMVDEFLKTEENERHFGILKLDFEQRAIILYFPENWDELSTEEQYLWIKKHLRP